MLPYKLVGYIAVTDDGGQYECEGACDGHFGYPCPHCRWYSHEGIESYKAVLKGLMKAFPEAFPEALPTDGAKIRMSMLDSKSDLKDLIDDCERFKNEGS